MPSSLHRVAVGSFYNEGTSSDSLRRKINDEGAGIKNEQQVEQGCAWERACPANQGEALAIHHLCLAGPLRGVSLLPHECGGGCRYLNPRS